MGALNSKISPSSEMLPTVEKGNGLFPDPRSPTLNINRSPISQEGVVTRASITKVKDLTSDLTSDVGSLQTPITSLPKRFQSIVDPRSPSTFTRTPLVVDPCSVGDCSLTTVVSSLHYEDSSIIHEENIIDLTFDDCDPQMPDLCNLQIEYDDSIPIIEPTDEKEETIFEDAEVVPFAGNDPRSPCIAIVRTPVVLFEDDAESEKANGEQVENILARIGEATVNAESQQRTPQQGIMNSSARGEQTPKKDKLTPSAVKSGNRTPLGCVTNIGAVSNIRKMALMGQMKQQNMSGDEQKLIIRSGNSDSAEVTGPTKNMNRSRIPKLRLS